MANPDASREAAHRRMDAARELAAGAGATTQAAVNEAYRQLWTNNDWVPDENFASNYNYGAQAWAPAAVPEVVEPVYQNQIPQTYQPFFGGRYDQPIQLDTQEGKVPELEAPGSSAGETNLTDSQISALSSRYPESMSVGSETPFDRIVRDSGIGSLESPELNPMIEHENSMADIARRDVDNYQGSQRQLSDITRDAIDWQNEWDERTKDGILPQWMNQEIQRRTTDMEDGSMVNPLSWNIMGFSSQQVTPEPIKRLYDFHFAKEGPASSSQVAEESGNDPLSALARRFRDRTSSSSDNPVLSNLTSSQIGDGIGDWMRSDMDVDAIDDGSPENRGSLLMDGATYRKYREQFGIPGRPIELIDDDETYNKQDEQEDYGFIPYIPDIESWQEFHDKAAPHAMSGWFNDLANLRRSNTDFTVNYDGKELSGKDLIERGNLWWKRVNADAENAEQITDPTLVDEYSVPFVYTLVDSSGNEYYAPSSEYTGWRDGETGKLYMLFGRVNNETGDVEYPAPDENGDLHFSDGETGTLWTFDNDADVEASLRHDKIAEDGGVVSFYKNIEPLVLGDGTTIRADKAYELIKDSGYKEYADYGSNGWNNPYIEDPFTDTEGNTNYNPFENQFAPWLVDTALGSIPFFTIPSSAAYGLSNSMASYTGFRPGYQDYITGGYSKLAENPTHEDQVSAAIGSLAMPVTEHLYGNIGSSLLSKPLMKLLKKSPADVKPLARYAAGTVGEGLEEIPGNVVEEIVQNGLTNWYADDMYYDQYGNLTKDSESIYENGNVRENRRAYDTQGRSIKDSDTDVMKRLRNFAEDAPLAFIGGASLGGILGSPRIGTYRSEYNQRKRERDEFGDNLIRPEVKNNLVVDLTDEEREYYDR